MAADGLKGSRFLTGSVLLVTIIGAVAVAADGLDSPSPRSPIQDGVERLQQQSCMTAECHTEYKDLRYEHGPVALGRCLDCHDYDEEDSTPYESGDDHWFDTVERDGRLCSMCHESKANEPFVHFALQRFQCIGCHDPHGSDNPGMMRHERMADNCYECHERKMDDERLVHAPLRVGACTLCHDPHGSPNAFSLVAQGPELCFRCHTDVAAVLEASDHVHRPVMEDCAQCHSPHDSSNDTLLRETVPDLCLGCHEDMARHIGTATQGHGALQEEGSCLNCHDPHASNFAKQLRDVPINLCMNCHDKPLVGEHKILPDMQAYLEENPNHHGPLRSGDCSACHDPHGSDHVALVAKPYPRLFYAPFEVERYSLCFACHEKSMVLDPESETVTNFRDGHVNLHYLHVNKEKKGRTCRACHDVHASQHPLHIANQVPFGDWDMPIQYEKLPSGGSCSPGCHETRSYDRTRIIEGK